MELEPWGRAARGLREHVRQVADALGCTGDAFWVQTEEPVSAYLPLEQRLYGFPDRDAALLWDARHGWAAAVEDGVEDVEPLTVAYLGRLLPDPDEVAAFVADLVEGRPTGRTDPPRFTTDPDLLRAELAVRAPQLATSA
jgi:hypothetical protein